MTTTLNLAEPADLAWLAGRQTLDALEPDQRAWFEQLADEIPRMVAEDDAFHEGCTSADAAKDIEQERDEANAELEAIAQLVGLETDDEPVEHAVARALAEAAEPDREREAEMGALLERAREEGRKDALVPSRRSAEMKGRMLVLEGRVELLRVDVDGGWIHARVRGDNGHYDAGYDPRQGRWRCSCEEMRGNCSHLHAVKLVTVRPTRGAH